MFEAALKGQVALVTGGSRGIGRATVLALAQAGADVVLSYSSQADTRAGHPGIADATADEARALGVRALTLEADVADPASAQVMIDSTVEGLGRLDVVVNNAGIARDNLAIRMTNAEWDLVIAIDLSAAFHVCRAALKPMLRQRSGRLINVSSIAGIMGNPGQANYSAAKAGLIGLTKTLAREVGSRGITVNAVAPGFIETDMTAALGDKVLNYGKSDAPRSSSDDGSLPCKRCGRTHLGSDRIHGPLIRSRTSVAFTAIICWRKEPSTRWQALTGEPGSRPHPPVHRKEHGEPIYSYPSVPPTRTIRSDERSCPRAWCSRWC